MIWWEEIRNRVAGGEIIATPEDMTTGVLFLEPEEIQTWFQRKLGYAVPMGLSHRQKNALSYFFRLWRAGLNAVNERNGNGQWVDRGSRLESHISRRACICDLGSFTWV
jgi:hypothetical protein